MEYSPCSTKSKSRSTPAVSTPCDPLSKAVSALREQVTPGSKSASAKKRYDVIASGGVGTPSSSHRHLSRPRNDSIDVQHALSSSSYQVTAAESPVTTRRPVVMFSPTPTDIHGSPVQQPQSYSSNSNIHDTRTPSPNFFRRRLTSRCISANSVNPNANGSNCKSPINSTRSRNGRPMLTRTNTNGNSGNPHATPTPSSGIKRAVCAKYDEDFKQAIVEQEIEYSARVRSVRNVTSMTVLLFLLYLTIGCLYYTRWSSDAKSGLSDADYDGQQWPLEEALIFLVYTCSTVGYGNHSIPSTPRDRVATIIFIMVGIALVTVFLSEIFQYVVIQATRVKYTHDEQKLYNRGMKMVALNLNGGGGYDNDNDENMDAMDLENQRVNIVQKTTTNVCRFSHICRSLVFDTCAKFKTWMEQYLIGRIIGNVLPFALTLLIGAVVVGTIEEWSAIDAFYWAVVTMTTVGYGDLAPSKPASIWFCIFYLPCSTVFLSLFLSKVAVAYIRLHEAQISRIKEKLQDKYNIHNYKSDEDASINMMEWQYNGIKAPNTEEGAWSPMKLELTKSGETDGSTPEQVSELVNSPSRAHNSSFNPVAVATPSAMKQNSRGAGNLGMSMRDILASAKKGDTRFTSTRNLFEDEKSRKRRMQYSSLGLRARVQERLAYIIATEFCDGKPKIDVKGDSIQLTFSNWKAASEKWMIPKKAKEHLKSVACEIILSVGTDEMKKRRIDAILELDPDYFQRRFNPVIAHFGSPECMEGWMRSTDPLTEEDEY